MSDEYDHDLDWPWTLYFNGEPMPRWANCWDLCDLLLPAKELIGEQTRIADFRSFKHLCYRMDLAHVVESEEGDIFRIHCLTLFHLLLRNEPSVLTALAPIASDKGTTAEVIYRGVRDGLVAMHGLALRDGIAFWSVGYEADHTALLDAIQRSRLPSSHPDYLDPPHCKARRDEVSSRARSLRSGLLTLLTTQHQTKEVRRFIHELPTKG